MACQLGLPTHLNTTQTFPQIVLLNIYYNLGIKDLHSCFLVNKHFNKLSNSDILWDKLLHNRRSTNCIKLIKENYGVTKSKIIYKIADNLLTINKIFRLKKTMEELINLRQLTNNINLTKLCHPGIALNSIPQEIGSLINLHYFDIRRTTITEVPYELCSLVNLQTLHLNSNKFTKFPKEICSLVNLQTLNLSDNQLTELPTEISYLTKLEILTLADNSITELPAEIGCLVNLQSLNISYNKLATLPTQISHLTNLNSLDLNDNQLTVCLYCYN